jgi:hypothetical protein
LEKEMRGKLLSAALDAVILATSSLGAWAKQLLSLLGAGFVLAYEVRVK